MANSTHNEASSMIDDVGDLLLSQISEDDVTLATLERDEQLTKQNLRDNQNRQMELRNQAIKKANQRLANSAQEILHLTKERDQAELKAYTLKKRARSLSLKVELAVGVHDEEVGRRNMKDIEKERRLEKAQKLKSHFTSTPNPKRKKRIRRGA